MKKRNYIVYKGNIFILLYFIAERGEDFDGSFNSWDSSYYERILLENEYSVDQEEIKKFFSLETTIQSTC